MLTLLKRRWFGFGIRTLLLAVAICAAYFARISYLARQQREAIRLIKSLGGSLSYDHNYDGASKPNWPAWLRAWVGEEYFRRVQGVALVSEDFTDEGLKTIASLGDLKVLRFHSSQVTDKGIAYLRACKGLEALEIRWAKVTDAGMADIGTLTNIKELQLLNTKITDDGLPHLSTLKQLETLIIGNFAPHGTQPEEMDRYVAPITGWGLDALGETPNLKTVELFNTQSTWGGDEFQRKRPAVRFSNGGGFTRFPPAYSLP